MAPLTHVLFDFFGTLVEYSDSLVDQGFDGSYEVLVSEGTHLSYSGFLEQWSLTFNELEALSGTSLDEFTMDEVCERFLERALPRCPDDGIVARFRDTYLDEWNKGVEYIPEVPSLLAELSERYTLALVTNTHSAELVEGHLRAIGATGYFATVVHSVEHGKRKPSACIFESAIERSAGQPENAVFVGDSYLNDYQGALAAGLGGLLIDPEHRYEVPAQHRLGHVLDLREALAI
ncbi:MAG: HAD family hydrolase [Gaiellaceae bacterium]